MVVCGREATSRYSYLMTSQPDDLPPMPCLKEAKWAGSGHTVCRPLLALKEASLYMPVVAIGYDHPHTFEFIDTTRLAELKTTAAALEARAIAALCTRPAQWTPMDLELGGKTLRILTYADDYFAAERVLDAAFMRKAQAMLKAEALFVGVPRRGLLMAIDGLQEEPLLRAFGSAVAGQFSRGETALISPAVFSMQDGVIVGFLDQIARHIVPDAEPTGPPEDERDDEDEEGEGDPGEPYVMGMVARNDRGTEDVILMAGGEDGLRLAKAIETNFMGLLKEHMVRAEFSGHIQIVVLGNTPVSARTHIPSILEHLRGTCNELSRGKEQRYRVSLTYQRDTLSEQPEAPKAAPAPRATAAPRPRPTPAVEFEPDRPRPPWLKHGTWVLLLLAGVAAAYFAFNGSAVSYPGTITYGGAPLSRATLWDRDGTSAAVYIPPGESMPGASRQVGVIVSTKYATPGALLGWVREQSQAALMQPYHDETTNQERCLAAMDGARFFLSLQVCQAGTSRAGCIELDDVIDADTLNCVNGPPGCFAAACAKKLEAERAGMQAVLASVMDQ